VCVCVSEGKGREGKGREGRKEGKGCVIWFGMGYRYGTVSGWVGMLD